MAQAPEKVEATEKIKEAFEAWDVDQSGTISRQELRDVMSQLCGALTENDLDILMKEVDTNGDGIIQYNEFVEWLMKPVSRSRGAAILEFSEALMPLFKVYDRNSNGTISQDEFVECHTLIQGALRLHPTDLEDSKLADPMQLQRDTQSAFDLADLDGDQQVSFREFVDWLRDSIVKAHLTQDQAKEFLQDLACALHNIFTLEQELEEGQLDDVQGEAVLTKFIQKLADKSREFRKVCSEVKSVSGGVGWSEPPRGLNVDTLKTRHLKHFPLNLKKVSKQEYEILVVPMAGSEDNPEERQWVGEIIRSVEFKTGRKQKETPAYYKYERATFSWTLVSKDEEKHFEEAIGELAGEMRVFCVLKTAANFGTKLNWAQVQNSLRCCVDMNLITPESLERYNDCVLDMAYNSLLDDGINHHADTDEAVADSMNWLSSHYVCRPREVMGVLSELGITRVSPIWQDFVNHE